MKRLGTFSMLLFLVLTANIMYAQNTKNTKPPLTLCTNESGAFIFDTIMDFKGVSKTALYKRASSWIGSNVKTLYKVKISDDSLFNEIRTDANIPLKGINGSSVKFKIVIFFKENRCKIVFESFVYHYNYIGEEGLIDADFANMRGTYKKMIYKDFDKEFSHFKNSLFKALNTDSANEW